MAFPGALAAQGRPHDALQILRAGSGAQDCETASPFEDLLQSTQTPTASAALRAASLDASQGFMGLTGEPPDFVSALSKAVP